jgi:hypothetical protein
VTDLHQRVERRTDDGNKTGLILAVAVGGAMVVLILLFVVFVLL